MHVITINRSTRIHLLLLASLFHPCHTAVHPHVAPKQHAFKLTHLHMQSLVGSLCTCAGSALYLLEGLI